MPYGITQCYLPPGRGDIPALGELPPVVPSVGGSVVLDPTRPVGPLDP